MESLNRNMVVSGGGGICSCLMVRMHDFSSFVREHEIHPISIDSTNQFPVYGVPAVADYIFDPINVNEVPPYLPVFDHGWGTQRLDEISVNIEELHKYSNHVNPFNNTILTKASSMRTVIGDRTVVLYRGNDKVLDQPATPYHRMSEMIKDTGSSELFVQTDEAEFYNMMQRMHKHVGRFEQLPMISKNANRYVNPPREMLVEWMQDYIAALLAISSAKTLVLQTGNTGFMTLVFRGNTRNVWQYDSITDRISRDI